MKTFFAILGTLKERRKNSFLDMSLKQLPKGTHNNGP